MRSIMHHAPFTDTVIVSRVVDSGEAITVPSRAYGMSLVGSTPGAPENKELGARAACGGPLMTGAF